MASRIPRANPTVPFVAPRSPVVLDRQRYVGASGKATWVRLLKPPVEGKLIGGHEGVDVGDQIKVQLTGVNIERGFIDFVREGSEREPSVILERSHAVQ